ncbi:MAG: zinc-ribbon domain-containing protein [Tissierellia bacterium]|nr:zinc-ribbon domain-containing protein [Tissierellia bacterium]
MAKCKNCGNVLKPLDNFCKKCGTPADHSEEPICTNCGFELKPDEKFCKKCGTPVTTVIRESEEPADLKDFDYSVDYDKLYEDDPNARVFGTHYDDEMRKIEELEKEIQDSRGVEEPGVEAVEAKAEDPRVVVPPIVPGEAFLKQEPKAEGRGQEEDLLNVPSFLSKSKDRIDNIFDTTKLPKGPRSEEIFEESQTQNKAEPKGPAGLDLRFDYSNKDHTVLLPGNLEELDINQKNGDRAVLSDRKKKLIKKSKEVKADINHDLGAAPTQESSPDEASFTQKIRLDFNDQANLAGRKVRESTHSNRTDPEDEPVFGRDGQEDREKKPAKAGSWTKYLIPVLVVIAIFSVLYATMSGLTDKKRVIAKFEESIQSDNYGAVASMVQSSADGVAIDANTVTPFVNLLNTDQIYRSSLIGAIKEDSSKQSIDPNYVSTRPYRLENVGKKYLFFDDYRIVVDPLDLNLDFEAGRAVNLSGQEVTEPVTGLKLLPGLYEASYVDAPDTVFPINLSPTNEQLMDGALTVSLSGLEGVAAAEEPKPDDAETEPNTEPQTEPKPDGLAGTQELHIDTAQPEALVYINGESTGVSVAEYNEIPQKSIKAGDRIKIGFQYPWGIGFSSETVYDGEALLSFTVDLNNNETMEVIMGRIEQMLKEDGEARAAMSTAGFTTIMEPEISATKEIIDNGVANGMRYYRIYETLNYDPNSFDISPNGEGGYTAYLGGYLTYRATEYPEGGSLETAPTPAEMGQIVGFHLTYMPDQSNWFIHMWGTTERYIDTEAGILHQLAQ